VLRLAVRVARPRAELVLAELLELAPEGVEEVDVDPRTVEYAVYGAEGELPALADLEAAAGGALVSVSTSEVAEDWAERWRAFHRPLVIATAAPGARPRLTVRPPWEPPADQGLDVVIDPGRAFGTGAHATTALCLELLLRDAARGGRGSDRAVMGSCVDLGCGSGVLAIVAARLGYAPVLALDHDPLAVEATAENAARNGLPPGALEIRRFDLRSEQVPAAELVLANVLAGPLLGWARSQREMPARLVLSGLLAAEADRVAAAYARRGMVEAERRVRGEWAALALAHGTPGATGDVEPAMEAFRGGAATGAVCAEGGPAVCAERGPLSASAGGAVQTAGALGRWLPGGLATDLGA
jgi:ribosomal protein L11 methyltransferase